MLKKIREKPHHEKQIIAGIITVILFFGIVFIWWSSRDARSRELEVQAKTVSPIDGVTSMFSGFVSGFKEKMANTPTKEITETTTRATEKVFDLSGVVIIDPSSSVATTTEATSTHQGL